MITMGLILNVWSIFEHLILESNLVVVTHDWSMILVECWWSELYVHVSI